MIEIKGLNFGYRKFDFSLSNVSFAAKDGEITAILGPNGAGKSTLVKCVTGVLKPLSGEVIADGKNVNEMRVSEKARTFAYVPQSVIMDETSVFEAVLTGRRPYIKLAASANDFAVTEKILKELSLDKLALKNVCELSGGERQKVAIAAALAQETKSIFFDEPTANLDIRSQIEVMELVRDIAKKKGIAVVINMHDLNLAYRYSDSYVLMQNGKVRSLGEMPNISSDALSEVFGTRVEFIEADAVKTIIYGEIR